VGQRIIISGIVSPYPRCERNPTCAAFVFATERGGPFTPDAVNRLIKRIGGRAGIGFPIHAHILRHACGYALANAGHNTRRTQDWLGHRSIQHRTRYTQSSAAPFKDF
jgi:integrase